MQQETSNCSPTAYDFSNTSGGVMILVYEVSLGERNRKRHKSEEYGGANKQSKIL